ncbi:MAG: hypothetical protein CVU50_10660 [Candidatus Cloacimonetes bacterium HGW-Cloacimonetes-3]|jgi:hypothetical protein|nr:MAG: hypothetical protein CVU50_10660 [Candidatus Cloacimonetes bacterium HGW-Cloacimonetes-3]
MDMQSVETFVFIGNGLKAFMIDALRGIPNTKPHCNLKISRTKTALPENGINLQYQIIITPMEGTQ